MRSRGSPRCSSSHVSWPSFWGSFPSFHTERRRHHPESSKRLRSPCAARSRRADRDHATDVGRLRLLFFNTLSFLQSVQVLDVGALLLHSVQRRRTILTVPWLVEFLSMMDGVGPLLPCYKTALGTLLLLYRSVIHYVNDLFLEVDFLYFQRLNMFDVTFRRMLLGRGGEMCYLNKLLMVSVLGWLFQVGFCLQCNSQI